MIGAEDHQHQDGDCRALDWQCELPARQTQTPSPGQQPKIGQDDGGQAQLERNGERRGSILEEEADANEENHETELGDQVAGEYPGLGGDEPAWGWFQIRIRNWLILGCGYGIDIGWNRRLRLRHGGFGLWRIGCDGVLGRWCLGTGPDEIGQWHCDRNRVGRTPRWCDG